MELYHTEWYQTEVYHTELYQTEQYHNEVYQTEYYHSELYHIEKIYRGNYFFGILGAKSCMNPLANVRISKKKFKRRQNISA